ncbi:beta transducin-like protein HET-E2C [Lasiosphaeria hispida]|uniref:Beta transducin-like protein HET-E2C n=1 Tax=Lasiosphaeria hispida TaxID=260671 RepID=A0AAJ0HFH6_9PEZI|nr:beta transducin-like protein HET-E2C [Lasiosphaeria hispida]
MRLLERDDNGDFHLTKDFLNNKIPPYAILSHTWGDGEVLFKDLMDGTGKNKAGYAKIQFCGDQARYDAIKFFWVDTCCIDKSNNTELQEAINSMFRWYRDAAKCYAYLVDVSIPSPEVDDKSIWEPAFRASRWFTRGWTLQELIAPTSVEFFSREKVRLGDRKSLERIIHNVTGIPLKALRGSLLSDFSVCDRMAWIGKRNTTREEDMAYSLFGIFDVQLPLLYGEGKEKALERLREKTGKDDGCLADLRVTDPRDDKKRIEDGKGGLLRDSYRWVLNNAEFRRWYDSEDSSLLWIFGDPGKGKTMLLCGIIDDLLSYFFCQATDSHTNNATIVLRGLIYLLIVQQPTLVSHLRRKYDHAGKTLFEDANAWFALSEIFGNILQDPSLQTTYFVIDALDECIIGRQQLLKLVTQNLPVSSRIKWIISSRNWTEIGDQLKMATQGAKLSLELNAESITSAVNTYIWYKVDQLAELKKYDPKTRDAVRHYLSSHADGTFLWVALVCHALADPMVRKRHSLEMLRTFPPGLDSLYTQTTENIRRSRDADLCRHILAVTAIVHRPVSLQELVSLIEVLDSFSEDLESLEEVIGVCGSFLSLRKGTVYFVHQSAKDFLLGDISDKTFCKASQEAFNWVFPSGKEKENCIIVSRSLNVMSGNLQRDIYSLKAPGFPIDHVRLPDPDPLARVRYLCVYWVSHLSDAVSGVNANLNTLLQDNGPVHSFFEEKYLYWLEALSLLRAMSDGVLAIRRLEGLLSCTNQGQLLNLVRDAHRFTLSYRWIIEQAPLQAYTSALIFVPTSSLVKKCFRANEPDWISTKPVVEADWNACLQTLEGHDSSVRSVAFSPDGQQLASGSGDETIKIWDPASGQCRQTLEGHDSWVRSVTFSPDGQQLASGSSDKTIKIWDPASGQCRQTLEGHDSSVQSVAFSPDGQQLASGSSDKTIKIWDPASGQCRQTLEGHDSSVRSVTFSPDGQQLASGSDDKTIKIWDPASGQCRQTLKGHDNWVQSVAFSPDGQQLASGSSDETIKIWDPASGQCRQTLKGHDNWVQSVAFSPDGQQLASGSSDETIKIWDPASGQCRQTLKGHDNWVRSVAFSPDGQQLASGSDDKTIKIWDPASGQCRQMLKGHDNWVQSVAFSPDGQQLASGSSDKTIKIWDPASGQCRQTLKGHDNSVWSVTFSPDGQQLASGSDDTTIKIWDPTSGQCRQTLKGHDNWVQSVAFSPDGQQLASGSSDTTIKIWDPASGQCRQTLKGHDSWVRTIQLDNLVKQSYNLGQEWITCNGKNVLWLPPEYRPCCSAVQGRMISIGCSSGRVFTIGFSRDV